MRDFPVVSQTATISIWGADKLGLIARITQYLFEQQASIEALEKQVTCGQFRMAMQTSWKNGNLNLAKFRDGLSKLARELDVEVTLRFADLKRVQRMAVMVTQEPHCLDALLAACSKGKIKTEPALVISNRLDLEAQVQERRVPFLYVPWEDRAKAIEAGLVYPATQSCKLCHNDQSPTFKGFDEKSYFEKIAHPDPKVKH